MNYVVDLDQVDHHNHETCNDFIGMIRWNTEEILKENIEEDIYIDEMSE